MNTGIANAFDLGWKLASVIQGSGGIGLLESYEVERKPVAKRCVQHSAVYFQVHFDVKDVFAGNPKRLDDDSEESRALRAKVHEYYQLHDGENKDTGIQLGYRYKSPIIVNDEGVEEPVWVRSMYTPTTWLGGRPPHCYLRDGTPIFDMFGKHWTLLVFLTSSGEDFFIRAATGLNIPLKVVNLTGEELARTLYERALVLIRPDQHVAYRSDTANSIGEAERVLTAVTGRSDIR